MVQKTRPHTMMPTSMAATMDQVHRCCMRVAWGVMPSGHPARSTGLLISVMEHPESASAARPIVPARTPLRAIRRRPPCVTFTPSLPCPTLGVLPEILQSVDHGNQETRTRVVSDGCSHLRNCTWCVPEGCNAHTRQCAAYSARGPAEPSSPLAESPHDTQGGYRLCVVCSDY